MERITTVYRNTFRVTGEWANDSTGVRLLQVIPRWGCYNRIMKPRAKNTKFIGPLMLGLGVIAALTCGGYFLLQPRIGGDSNAALGIPNTGNVRVVTTPLESGTDKLHYKWSLIGSSNWRKATATATGFSLGETYPLNSTQDRGGCNVYEADLTADGASGKWNAVLHGSDGTTVHTEGVLPTGKSVSDVVRISQTAASAAMGTPTDITLAQIDGVPLRLSVAR